MQEGVVKDGIYDALVAALAGFPTVENPIVIIWGNQNEHRLPKPYVALFLTGPIGIGQDEERVTSDAADPFLEVDEINHCGMREVTLSINFFGTQALEAMSLIKSRLNFHSIRAILRESGLVHVRSEEPRDLSGLQNSKTETRLEMDVTFRFAENMIEGPADGLEFIEAVTGENLIEETEFEVDPDNIIDE